MLAHPCYLVKTGVTSYFYSYIDCEYLLELPKLRGSNKYLQIVF